MGRGAGCCNFKYTVNCTAPPCPTGSCCFVTNQSVNEFVEFDNSNTFFIDKKLNNYSCEDFVTENCCLAKPFSIFNKNELCGEIQVCETGSTIALPSIYNTDTSFCLLTHEGNAIVFGRGNGSRLPNSVPFLQNVVSVYSNNSAFCAVHKDGTATVWGDEDAGGFFAPSFTPGEEPDTLDNIKSVIPSHQAFAAIKKDGTVIAWGNPKYGGSIPSSIKNLLVDIVEIVPSQFYFAARNKDGRIFIWGNGQKAYDKRDVNLSGEITILDAANILNHLGLQSTDGVDPDLEGNYYSAYDVNRDGRVTVGDALIIINALNVIGGPTYDSGFTDIKKIYSTEQRSSGFNNFGSGAFAFLKNDGTVLTWGNPSNGGNTGEKQSDLTNVKKIYNTQQAFAALRNDGKVVMWGDLQTLKDVGPDSTFYDEVVDIIPSLFAFGLYYYKASQVPDKNYFQVEQFFEVIGSIVPNKPTLVSVVEPQFGVTDQTAYWDGKLLIERKSFLSSVSYPLSENYTISRTKNRIYASNYAMHIFHNGRGLSLGNNPFGQHGAHTFDNPKPGQAYYDTFGNSDNYRFIGYPIRLDNEDGLSSTEARENNALFHKSRSFVFSSQAVAYLTEGTNAHTRERLNVNSTVGFDKELNYVVSFGNIAHGGNGSTFMKTGSNSPNPIGNKGYFQGLYSNQSAFCGIRISKNPYPFDPEVFSERTSWGASAGQPVVSQSVSLDNESLSIRDRNYLYEIVTWGGYGAVGSVPVRTNSTPFDFVGDLKDTYINHQGCLPDYCNQDIK